MIRPAIAADLPSILDIYNDAILNTTAVYDYVPHTLAMRESWFAAKQQAGFPVLVAEAQSQVVGFGALGAFRAWEAYRYTAENSLYVAPQCRGQGFGKQLLAQLLQAAADMQLHAIVAGIDADNSVSLKLHEQFGFQEVAHFPQVGYKFDRWLDLKFMQCLLPASDLPASLL
ncbi:MAG: N-acetyltransferase [Leptolyngbya sp. SIOISBB]|nr:N-acetyltransferase [Leptolyngbya sp. SIOISBB]